MKFVDTKEKVGVSKILFGQSAVLRVASEILLRGSNIYFPSVDIGADIIVANGARVQVKATKLTLRKPPAKSKSYHFQLHGFRLQGIGKEATWKRKSSHFSEKCDFVVLYGQTEQKFWIIPAAELDGHSQMEICEATRCIDVDVEAIKEARAAGYKYKEIAEYFNIDAQTVISRLKHGETPRVKVTNRIKSCENRWDFILTYGSELKMELPSITEEVKKLTL